MPRFVLLFHDCPARFGKPSHWDLMLERGDALMTWSLRELPLSWQKSDDGSDGCYELVEIIATRLPDHRLAYLDYEGPIGGDRGRVTRQDRGHYAVINESADFLEVRLDGTAVKGRVSLSSGQPLPARESQPPF